MLFAVGASGGNGGTSTGAARVYSIVQYNILSYKNTRRIPYNTIENLTVPHNT